MYHMKDKTYPETASEWEIWGTETTPEEVAASKMTDLLKLRAQEARERFAGALLAEPKTLLDLSHTRLVGAARDRLRDIALEQLHTLLVHDFEAYAENGGQDTEPQTLAAWAMTELLGLPETLDRFTALLGIQCPKCNEKLMSFTSTWEAPDVD